MGDGGGGVGGRGVEEGVGTGIQDHQVHERYNEWKPKVA